MVEVDTFFFLGRAKFQNDPGQSHLGGESAEGQDAGASTSQSVTTQRLDPEVGIPSLEVPNIDRHPSSCSMRALECGQRSLAVSLANGKACERSEAGGRADVNLSHGPDPRFFSSTAGTYGIACLPPSPVEKVSQPKCA